MARCDSGARSPRGADRTQLRHHRHDAGVEHRRQRLQGLHADAGMAAHQRVDADAQHRAHHVRRERLADADRMGDDQVVLQFLVQRASGRASRPATRRAADARRAACRRCCRSRSTRRRSAPRGAPARRGNPRRARPPSAAPASSSTLAPWRSRPAASRVSERPSRRIGFMLSVLRHARACSSSTRRRRGQFGRAALRTARSRRRSLTVTTPRASSSSPRSTTKRMPARSAYWNCLASLRGSSCDFGVDAGRAQALATAPAHRGSCASSISVDQHLHRAVARSRPGRLRAAARTGASAPIEMPTPGSFDLV